MFKFIKVQIVVDIEGLELKDIFEKVGKQEVEKYILGKGVRSVFIRKEKGKLSLVLIQKFLIGRGQFEQICGVFGKIVFEYVELNMDGVRNFG